MSDYIIIKTDENGVFKDIEDVLGRSIPLGIKYGDGNIKIDVDELFELDIFKPLINEKIEEACYSCECQQCADFENDIFDLKDKITLIEKQKKIAHEFLDLISDPNEYNSSVLRTFAKDCLNEINRIERKIN